MLSPEAVELFDRAVLCWLATADADGNPSVSPKEIFTVISPTSLLIADIASPRSVRNIRGREAVCVSAIDVFEQHGYQAYGSARVLTAEADEFEELSRPLRALAGEGFRVRSVIEVEVRQVARIVAPSIWLYPETPPTERRRAALEAYGIGDAPS